MRSEPTLPEFDLVSSHGARAYREPAAESTERVAGGLFQAASCSCPSTS